MKYLYLTDWTFYALRETSSLILPTISSYFSSPEPLKAYHILISLSWKPAGHFHFPLGPKGPHLLFPPTLFEGFSFDIIFKPDLPNYSNAASSKTTSFLCLTEVQPHHENSKQSVISGFTRSNINTVTTRVPKAHILKAMEAAGYTV